MYKFDKDSISVRASKNKTTFLKLTTDPSIGACREGLVIDRDSSDKILIFTNLGQRVVDSVSINNDYKFLYVYFNINKFEFRFENKQLNLE